MANLYDKFWKFQSLFYWKYHFNQKKGPSICSDRRVSILILLEVPLQPQNQQLQRCYMKSFNPYFTGSTTSTYYEAMTKYQKEGFQSLFYWKYHFNIMTVKDSPETVVGFNPYFTGSTTSTSFLIFNLQTNSNVSILILLEVPLQLVLTHPPTS